MDRITELKDRMAYEQWANKRVLDALEAFEGLPPPRPEALARPVRLFAHLLAVRAMWLARLKGEDYSGIEIWPEVGLGDLPARLASVDMDWLDFIDSLDESGLEGEITYQNTKGTTFANTFIDILRQLEYHGSYHRGQIAIWLREHGGEPARTDYIAFARTEKP